MPHGRRTELSIAFDNSRVSRTEFSPSFSFYILIYRYFFFFLEYIWTDFFFLFLVLIWTSELSCVAGLYNNMACRGEYRYS